MWPLCFLLNKLLRVGERNQGRSEGHVDSTSAKYCQFEPLVPHVHQLTSWDCGLACVLMVLRASGITSCTIEDLAEICPTNSIWTVDLAYLLQKFCVEFSYFTITFGANPNYSLEEFYKEQLHEDLVRVDLLFRKAHESGISIQRGYHDLTIFWCRHFTFNRYIVSVFSTDSSLCVTQLLFGNRIQSTSSFLQCRSVSIHEISCLLLSGNYIAIALVDQDKLSKSWFEEVIVAGLQTSNSSYTGHYIVICGYDAVRDEFEIRDPASSKTHEKISSKCLENARKSFGTDEDLLLINLENIRNQNRY